MSELDSVVACDNITVTHYFLKIRIIVTSYEKM